MAQWLNSTFASFDYAILEFFHSLAQSAGGFLTPIANIFAIIGDVGLFGFLIAFALMLFPKTRKCGICMAFSIIIGALFTNIFIKNAVARPRPYASEVTVFLDWWKYVGSPIESEFSFPSGHTTAAMASMSAMCIASGKSRKWLIVPAALYVVLMAASRNYLMVHYPTDVIAAFIVGAVSGVLACIIINFVWKFIEKKSNVRLFAFALNFDIRNLFKKKQS